MTRRNENTNSNLRSTDMSWSFSFRNPEIKDTTWSKLNGWKRWFRFRCYINIANWEEGSLNVPTMCRYLTVWRRRRVYPWCRAGGAARGCGSPGPAHPSSHWRWTSSASLSRIPAHCGWRYCTDGAHSGLLTAAHCHHSWMTLSSVTEYL